MSAKAAAQSVESIVGAYADWRGGLMPALHALQHHVGYIDRSLIPLLAETFNITDAEVHGVISFYKDFRTTPPKGPIVQVCRGEACQARGAGEVFTAANAVADSGEFAVEVAEVFCLGVCASGPTVAVGGTLHHRVDVAAMTSLLRSASAKPVSQVAAGGRKSQTNGQETVVYVPCDAAACAAGADQVAGALAAQPGVHVVRNGSRGMLWLEPLVEVVTPQGRVAYGPVTAGDLPSLLQAGMLTGAAHTLRIGSVDEQSWMQRQQRFTFRRVGVIDPRDPDDFVAHGGLAGLRRALAMKPAEVVAAVTASGLRGRGGAAFPTGIKWLTVLDAPGAEKFIACNADEGDSGTFADRMLMEGDPFTIIEGMIIAGWAVGAHDGFIYIRSEYPDAIATMRVAITVAEERGWLNGAGSGGTVLDSGFVFRLHVRLGAGAYICGEETAMLESLEGRRGVVRAKPPLPALEGLFGRPTVVNNVLSLGTVPAILSDGADAYAALGTGRSRGTQVFQLAGNIARGGIFEAPFGVTLGELVNDLGGGSGSGRPIRAVQVGGPLGSYLPVEQLGLPMDYEAFAAADALVGHGGIVVFDDTVDMAAQARFAMEFCAIESCGKCTPCRIGSTRGVELIDKITAGVDADANMSTLLDLCEVMADGSLCAMGGLTPLPVRSALTHFADDFHTKQGALA
ncbi:MAG: NAD(P)H-dependent oxidoreductase subunit E [Actinobacteria bacterium]|nr:NAD(P)H-dependent oxidoreductase subunit E [Actinomycetota bacterium]